ncbi:NADH dehydrogenase [Pseudarcicella hirudinis]|uniref:NADH:ubiquinone reductase (non-electrogenic) n=1 Tax=Pseudarcicella hirudinis TaxID=1079859 RepID=A0A1I5WZ72_9BACT|nr:NAD(P)/FAD-dependent oxidoreductase [Pseudarcicella hirudinis]SFQ25019.1 NADH dehydrogenase [Pseudarcicella hirudinis]
MHPNIPETNQNGSPSKRVVIVGAGFGGLALAQKLAANDDFQVVILDKNNFHQFQPLFYQVATAGLEPSSIAFPLRKIFQNKRNVHIRITEVTKLLPETNQIETRLGLIGYDYLVLSIGADTNFFGMKNIQERSLPMKSVNEALGLRNRLLENLERALVVESAEESVGLINVVVVGGGPTGVEISGTLAEMKKAILPKEYPELNFDLMQVTLIESGAELLGPMSKPSQVKSEEYLKKLGVNVRLNTRVVDFDGKFVKLATGETIRTDNLVWAAGVKANFIEGLNPEVVARGGRLKVNRYNQVEGYQNIFALGDVALMAEEKYPNGHPQLAQAAIQQGKLLSENLKKLKRGESLKMFEYKDLGSMATVGRNLAVVDLPFWKFQGFFAWLTWMFVHLMSIVGVKNRLLIFINWLWNYITYDQSLRLIIRAKFPKTDDDHPSIL